MNYLNTKPLVYGFENGAMQNEIDLVFDYPAKVADALLKNEIDLGLIPVAVIPQLKEYHIIGDHCIAADGEVASVCLFSEVPIEEIKTVLLDYQSRTSVALAQVLCREFWKITPVFQAADNDFQAQIKGATAAVIIGDRALLQRKSSAYIYDLGLAWKEHTGLPFVFAAWISNKELPANFIQSFDAANEIGLLRLQEVTAQNNLEGVDLYHYYTQNIHYNLNAAKREGLALFLQKIAKYSAPKIDV